MNMILDTDVAAIPGNGVTTMYLELVKHRIYIYIYIYIYIDMLNTKTRFSYIFVIQFFLDNHTGFIAKYDRTC